MDAKGFDTASRLPVVVLYGKPGCHLCEEAYEALIRIQHDAPFELAVVNIQSDTDIFARYAEAIPVVEVGGVPICRYHVDEARFRECLQEVK